MYTFKVSPRTRPGVGVDSLVRAKVMLSSLDENGTTAGEAYTLQTDDRGVAHARLVPGKFLAVATAVGHADVEVTFDARQEGGKVTLPLGSAAGFEAKVTDIQGKFIPVKATIYSIDGDHPDFGPSSARTFVPCTEHNRISSYAPHLKKMKLSHLMATCSGIELTGAPLPVNHQSSFPLHRHPHTQNGGGPRIASNPVVQIKRLAMWDEVSEKIVQMNHPNLHQIYGDLDTDGVADQGFRGMLVWSDKRKRGTS